MSITMFISRMNITDKNQAPYRGFNVVESGTTGKTGGLPVIDHISERHGQSHAFQHLKGTWSCCFVMVPYS